MRFDKPELWIKWRNEYLTFLQEEMNINTAKEYVTRFGTEPSNDETLNHLLDDLGENLSGFERMYPMVDQDVAMVFINPGLNWRGSIGDEEQRRLDDNYQLAQCNPTDWRHRTAISMDGGAGWLRQSRMADIQSLVRDIAHDTELIGKLSADVRRTGGFFSNIYYTNWYKFATKEAGDIPSRVRDSDAFSSEILREELAHLNPELVITFGGFPWEYGLYPHVEPVGDAPDTTSVTTVQNEIYEYDDGKVSFNVLPYAFPSRNHLTYNSSQTRHALEEVF